jgi:hypothetical protein
VKDLSGFRVPFLPDEQIWRAADRFREEYSGGKLPVDIEDIVEFSLGIEFFPLSGLRTEASIDSFLSSNCKTIFVDKDVFNQRGIPVRLRFSLAHEVGHLVLHQNIITAITGSTIEDWKQIRRTIPEPEYGKLEYQAYEFAGRLLVPPDALVAEIDKIRPKVEDFLRQMPTGDLDALFNVVHKTVSEKFQVSAEVIGKRLAKEGIIVV